ncbi:hypothetical protein [Streptococcus salivarius]|nr:hypothetical protein [Streptococcus salivarius]
MSNAFVLSAITFVSMLSNWSASGLNGSVMLSSFPDSSNRWMNFLLFDSW